MEREQCDRWIEGLRTGDVEAELEFWGYFGPSLKRLADQHLSRKLRRRMDPEDAVQSAFRTFIRRNNAGQYRVASSQDLWRLLCTITLTKVRERARFHSRQRRAIDREVSHDSGNNSIGFGEIPMNSPTAEQLTSFSEEFSRLLDALDSEERRVTTLKLEEFTNSEIAQDLKCSERTVERILRRIRTRFNSLSV